jgi:hypothetical protein
VRVPQEFRRRDRVTYTKNISKINQTNLKIVALIRVLRKFKIRRGYPVACTLPKIKQILRQLWPLVRVPQEFKFRRRSSGPGIMKNELDPISRSCRPCSFFSLNITFFSYSVTKSLVKSSSTSFRDKIIAPTGNPRTIVARHP